MEEWEMSDEELDQFIEDWEAVDRAAAAYLEERVPGLSEPVDQDEERWLDALVETFSPSEEPDVDPELFSSVMALQHADWLGLVLGALRRGPAASLEPDDVLADIDRLDEVEGEIEDPEGTRQVLEMAILTLTPPWQELGVLDQDERFTERGLWGLPRALHRSWTR
jgi:hypothetical protein